MADISYNPTFHHDPWEDNVDRVQAQGPNGFNIRFQTIESDLHGVSTVVAQIAGTIKPSPVTVTLTPTMLPVSSNAVWLTNSTMSIIAGTGGSVGVIPVPLPNGVQLTTIKAIGSGVDGGTVHTTFLFTAVAINGGANKTFSFNTGTVPLGTPATVDAATGLIDLTNFRYTFTASTGAAASPPVTISAFQFTYTQ